MAATPSMLKKLLARCALALLLVFAQQQASLHWLSHAIDATHAKAGSAALADHCDDCLAFAGLAAGATSAQAAPPVAPARHAAIRVPAVAIAPCPLRLGFDSRAPPILS